MSDIGSEVLDGPSVQQVTEIVDGIDEQHPSRAPGMGRIIPAPGKGMRFEDSTPEGV